jgi:hypothetical protein
MGKLTEDLRELLPTDCFTDAEVASIAQGSMDSRYGLVKRAIAAGDIIQLKRGVYGFGKRYQRGNLNLYEIAQRLYAPSYVSLETALAYHGWIPEAVYTVTSVCSKRSTQFETPVGLFSYDRIPPFSFVGVDRIIQNHSIFLIASPTKTLIDYIYVRKVDVKSIRDFAASLRIEYESFQQVSKEILLQLAKTYSSKRVTRFTQKLLQEIWL